MTHMETGEQHDSLQFLWLLTETFKQSEHMLLAGVTRERFVSCEIHSLYGDLLCCRLEGRGMKSVATCTQQLLCII